MNLGKRKKADFNALTECGSNAVQHAQGVAFIIHILQARNNGLPGPNSFRQIGLRKAGLRASCINIRA